MITRAFVEKVPLLSKIISSQFTPGLNDGLFNLDVPESVSSW